MDTSPEPEDPMNDDDASSVHSDSSSEKPAKKIRRNSPDEEPSPSTSKALPKKSKSGRSTFPVKELAACLEDGLRVRATVCALEPSELLKDRVEKMGLKVNLNIYPALLRKLNRLNRKKDSVKVAAGEWEVEEIVDGGLDDDGREEYKVRWKGWNDETWEVSRCIF